MQIAVYYIVPFSHEALPCDPIEILRRAIPAHHTLSEALYTAAY